MFIYLASPYTHADPSVQGQRFRSTTKLAAQLMERGFSVYSPITHGVAVVQYLPPERHHDRLFWIDQSFPILDHAWALFINCLEGWQFSFGVGREIERANLLRSPLNTSQKGTKMLTLSLQSIVISPTRQRREFDPVKLQELADSIDKHGLLQPIVVREVEGGWQLVCGERRLRAIRDYLLPLGGKLRYAGDLQGDGTVPAIPIGDLDLLAAEEAELEENIRREDLTWQERAAATARLADLRTRQAKERGASELPTHIDLSEEVRGSRDSWPAQQTFREVIVSKHLSNPAVAAAKSLDEAFKILRRAEDAEKNRALGERVGLTFSARDHSIHNTDALEWLENCADAQFDVILTDPIYGMGADEFGDSGGKTAGAHGYKDDAGTLVKHMKAAEEQFFRISKPQAHLYVFCDIDWFHVWRSAMTYSGWWVHRTPLIWHKPGAMRVPWPEHGPQRKYELILYAVKGKRPVNMIAPDVISINPDDNLGHAAQKPVALFGELLRRSVRAGDAVVDMFCGTGPIFPAAHELKCRAVGVEIDTAAYGIALKRLEELK